jgi:hypothetical protein
LSSNILPLSKSGRISLRGAPVLVTIGNYAGTFSLNNSGRGSAQGGSFTLNSSGAFALRLSNLDLFDPIGRPLGFRQFENDTNVSFPVGITVGTTQFSCGKSIQYSANGFFGFGN